MGNIYQCDCKSDKFGNQQGAKFQDKAYGQGRRIYTDSPLGKKMRCTVCGRDKSK